MADISILARLVNGATRNVDLTTNTPVVLSIKIGGVTNTELTKAILDNLITLQNGSDVGASLHHHDGRYFTESELSSTSGTSGAERIGVEATPTNYTAAQQNVEAHLAGIDAALANAGSDVFSDADFRIQDNGDATKQIAFEASAIATGTTRTVTMPNANVNLGEVNTSIQQDGSRAFTANQSMGGNNLTNLADPTAAQHAATKAYVDAVAEGMRPKEAVRVATTANITLSGPQTIDGISAVAGNRVLVKDQTAAENNGIYVVAAGAWSRASDFDSLTPIDEINRSIVAVQEGTANAGKIFVQQGTVATLGTDPINFVFYNSVSSLVGGDGITVSGSNIEVDHDGQGLQFSGNQLALELDGSTLSKSASGVKVADGGITETQLATSVAGNGLTGGGGSALAVNTGDGLEIVTDQVRVKSSDIAGEGVEDDGSNNLRVKLDGSSLSRSAAGVKVEHAPLAKRTMVAGESFAADTSFLVRMARTGETAGRVYKADYDASSNDNFYAIGIARSVSAVSAGQNIDVVILGAHTLGTGDTAFAAGDVGKAVFLTASGAFSVTAPNSVNQAVYRIGIVENTNLIFVQPQLIGVL